MQQVPTDLHVEAFWLSDVQPYNDNITSLPVRSDNRRWGFNASAIHRYGVPAKLGGPFDLPLRRHGVRGFATMDHGVKALPETHTNRASQSDHADQPRAERQSRIHPKHRVRDRFNPAVSPPLQVSP